MAQFIDSFINKFMNIFVLFSKVFFLKFLMLV